MSNRLHLQTKAAVKQAVRVHEGAERTRLPAHRSNEPQTLPLIVQDALRSSGEPLDPATRARMESRFGHNFNRVQIHTDGQAALAARSLNADAFTIGQDIFFAANRYRPETTQGQWLLAHELAHVLQQQHTTSAIALSDAQTRYTVTSQEDALEGEAAKAASHVAQGQHVPPETISLAAPHAHNVIARQPATLSANYGAEPQLLDPAHLIDNLVNTLLNSLKADPDDRSGRVRRQLSRLNFSTRESVFDRLQARLTEAQWNHLVDVLQEPAPQGGEGGETNEAAIPSETPPDVPPTSAQTPAQTQADAASQTATPARPGAEAARTPSQSAAGSKPAETDTGFLSGVSDFFRTLVSAEKMEEATPSSPQAKGETSAGQELAGTAAERAEAAARDEAAPESRGTAVVPEINAQEAKQSAQQMEAAAATAPAPASPQGAAPGVAPAAEAAPAPAAEAAPEAPTRETPAGALEPAPAPESAPATSPEQATEESAEGQDAEGQVQGQIQETTTGEAETQPELAAPAAATTDAAAQAETTGAAGQAEGAGAAAQTEEVEPAASSEAAEGETAAADASSAEAQSAEPTESVSTDSEASPASVVAPPEEAPPAQIETTIAAPSELTNQTGIADPGASTASEIAVEPPAPAVTVAPQGAESQQTAREPEAVAQTPSPAAADDTGGRLAVEHEESAVQTGALSTMTEGGTEAGAPETANESRETEATFARESSPDGAGASLALGIAESEGAAEDGGGGEGGMGGGGGGGGTAIPDPPQPSVPDVSQASPAEAMSLVSNLPPARLQSALGGVSSAVTHSVGEQRSQLASSPPQIERPSGSPPEQSAARGALAPGAAPSATATSAPQRVERAPTGAAVPTPAPAPLPPAPASPTQSVPPPRVAGNAQGQLSAEDAQHVQSAVSNLPVSDPALNVTAGPPPRLALEGSADPEHAREQRSNLETSAGAAEAEGQRDAAAPMGENKIYPNVPQETLSAESSGGGESVGAGAAVEAGGEASDEVASVIAQEQRGDEIRASVTQARSEMVNRQEEHTTRVSEEQATSQREMGQLVEENSAAQDKQRNRVREQVQGARGEWSEAQQGLVSDSREKADQAMQQGEGEITTEQVNADMEAARHVEQGNQEVASTRREAEQKAAQERRRAQNETSDGGFLSWVSSSITSFFNRVKDAINAAFESARRAVREFIQRAQQLALAVIERARQAIVNVINRIGNALIAIGDSLLAAFPALRERFRRLIRELVDRAVNAVNQLADQLKQGVQRFLNLLLAALEAALRLLQQGLQAAVAAANQAVQSAIRFARSVVQGFAAFAALIRDVVAAPGQWIRNLGAAVVDGIRNHLWRAFKLAVKNWFNQKVEEVLGLGMAIWQLLRRGGLSLSRIGNMAWAAIKQAIPMVLVSLLIEKLVSMIVPAAGAVLAIIEGLKAAWGAVSRIIQAFQAFFAFLQAVKTGSAGPLFANALAAAAIAVIEFVASWLLQRLRKPAGAVSGRIRAIAQRIGKQLRRLGGAVKRGAGRVVGAVRRAGRRIVGGLRRGVRAVGRRTAAFRRAVGRRVQAVVQKVRAVGRRLAQTRAGRLVMRGLRAVQSGYRRAREKFQQFRERRRQRREQRRQQRKKNLQDRLDRAAQAIRPTLTQLLRRGTSRLFLKARMLYWRVRYRLSALRLQSNGEIEARVNPGIVLVNTKPVDPEDIATGIDLEGILTTAETEYERFVTTEHPEGRAEYQAARERIRLNQPGTTGLLGGVSRDVQTAILRQGLVPPGRHLLEPGVGGRVTGTGQHLGLFEISHAGSYPTIEKRLVDAAQGYGVTGDVIRTLGARRPEAFQERLANLEANLLRGETRSTVREERTRFINRIRRSGILTQALEPARERGIATVTPLAYLLAERGVGGVGLRDIISREGGYAPMTPQKAASATPGPERQLAHLQRHDRVGRILNVIRREARSNVIVLAGGYDVAALREALNRFLKYQRTSDEHRLIEQIILFFRSLNQR